MGLLELALILSAVVALYNIQQIKITLKEKGRQVDMLTGLPRDYRQFKELIQKEPDRKVRAKYQKILNSLYFSLAGLVVFAFMILNNR